MCKTCNFIPSYVHFLIYVIESNGQLHTHDIFKKGEKPQLSER